MRSAWRYPCCPTRTPTECAPRACPFSGAGGGGRGAVGGGGGGGAAPAVPRTGRAARAVQARSVPAGTRRRNPDGRTELDEGLAQRGQGEDHADGERDAGGRQDWPEQPL